MTAVLSEVTKEWRGGGGPVFPKGVGGGFSGGEGLAESFFHGVERAEFILQWSQRGSFGAAVTGWMQGLLPPTKHEEPQPAAGVGTVVIDSAMGARCGKAATHSRK